MQVNIYLFIYLFLFVHSYIIQAIIHSFICNLFIYLFLLSFTYLDNAFPALPKNPLRRNDRRFQGLYKRAETIHRQYNG